MVEPLRKVTSPFRPTTRKRGKDCTTTMRRLDVEFLHAPISRARVVPPPRDRGINILGLKPRPISTPFNSVLEQKRNPGHKSRWLILLKVGKFLVFINNRSSVLTRDPGLQPWSHLPLPLLLENIRNSTCLIQCDNNGHIIIILFFNIFRLVLLTTLVIKLVAVLH